MTYPTESARSELYATLIQDGFARDFPLDVFNCLTCGEQHADCLCNTLPAYQGSDLSHYRTKEHSDGHRR